MQNNRKKSGKKSSKILKKIKIIVSKEFQINETIVEVKIME